jgi:hypothetical protein
VAISVALISEEKNAKIAAERGNRSVWPPLIHHVSEQTAWYGERHQQLGDRSDVLLSKYDRQIQTSSGGSTFHANGAVFNPHRC